MGLVAGWKKLGIIAGGGELPEALAAHCQATGAGFHVSRVAPFADAGLAAYLGDEFNIGEMGARIAALKAAGCDALVCVGIVQRPDISQVKFDQRGMEMAPALLAAARLGDDALLRALMAEFEKDGFKVVGADEVLGSLVAQAGAWGAVAPDAKAHADIAKAAKVAEALGAFDVGQGAVVCDGLVLALEAQEGTDAMLKRVASLPEAVRGRADARRGVLVKRPKPMQERRIDLPTIGVRTIEGAAAAGLAGVAVEAGGALVLGKDKLVAAADAAGLFVYGFTPNEIG
ncbi:MAG: UDP-2,3-diacylglucosamine diphosphatase LpxI [Hyphomonadaceae bacterium]|nr:UDP-2,3-diacylglucosamine diphosphatase LpxI [Hyphomonadaceae bacterium]